MSVVWQWLFLQPKEAAAGGRGDSDVLDGGVVVGVRLVGSVGAGNIGRIVVLSGEVGLGLSGCRCGMPA